MRVCMYVCMYVCMFVCVKVFILSMCLLFDGLLSPFTDAGSEVVEGHALLATLEGLETYNGRPVSSCVISACGLA